MQPLVELKEIVKGFSGLIANNRVDFVLYPGECHALVGENGAGKSTLMKILYGQYTPDSGQILLDGEEVHYDIHGAREHGIAMVHQNFMQVPELSITENITLGNSNSTPVIPYKAIEKKISELLKRFKMKADPSAPIRTLSVGERQKIEIIKALYFNARILILDEPTAVLTPQESEELFDIIDDLKREGRAVVFISHKLREVVRVGDRISVMRHGEMVQSNWKRGDVDENDIASAMIGQKNVKLIQSEHRSSGNEEEALNVKELWYIDERGIPKIKDLSFHVNKGEILGIGGIEGNGQTELIQLLIGILKPAHGSIVLNGKNLTNATVAQFRKAGMGFISDDRMTTGLVLDGTIEDNIIPGREYDPQFSKSFLLNKKNIGKYAEEMTQKYEIHGITPGKHVGALSGGNMQKIIIAREMDTQPAALIAAQPTRGLDIGAINFVRTQLLKAKAAGTAVILVSADLEELMSLSDRMIILYEGNISGEVTDVVNVTESEIGLMMGGVGSEA